MWRLRPVLKTLCQCPWQTGTSISKPLEWRPNMRMLNSRKWRNIYCLQQWGSWYLNKPWEDNMKPLHEGDTSNAAPRLVNIWTVKWTPQASPTYPNLSPFRYPLCLWQINVYICDFFLLVDLLLPRKRQRRQCRSPPIELKSVLLWLASYQINWQEFVESALWLPVKSVESLYLTIILARITF